MIALLRTLLGAQVFATQITRVKEEARRTCARVLTLLIATLLAVVAVGFFTAAGYISLVRMYGPVTALLIVGGAYLAFAVIVWGINALASRSSSEEQLKTPAVSTPDLAVVTQNMMQSVGEAVRQINPEEIAAKSGRTLMRNVGPLPLAGIAIVAGYILARRIDKG
ncbi:hypothetical protein [Pseudochelatococcus sp. G4_1912]|uniref:hypothetical protein n=1 Tax=Pseudochelatococcus sp. G4_1912 TaxID=3114288 RepID=UPI0039C75A32